VFLGVLIVRRTLACHVLIRQSQHRQAEQGLPRRHLGDQSEASPALASHCWAGLPMSACGAEATNGARAGLGDQPLRAKRFAIEQAQRRPGGVGRAAIDWRAGGRNSLRQRRAELRKEVTLRQRAVWRKHAIR